MEKIHKYSLIALLAGSVLFLFSILLHISWLGIVGYFVFAVGMICLAITTKIGLALLVSVGILSILAMLVFFGPVQLVKETQDLLFYHNNKDSVIEVGAVITDIVEEVGDGGADYVAYVSYKYDDKTYNNVHWKNVDSYSQLNSAVNVKISPEKPDEIFRSGYIYIIGVIWSFIVTVLFIISLVSLLSLIIKKKKTPKIRQNS